MLWPWNFVQFSATYTSITSAEVEEVAHEEVAHGEDIVMQENEQTAAGNCQ